MIPDYFLLINFTYEFNLLPSHLFTFHGESMQPKDIKKTGFFISCFILLLLYSCATETTPNSPSTSNSMSSDPHQSSSDEMHQGQTDVVGFRSIFQGYIKSNCSQEACHGGNKGIAGLRLVEVEEAYQQLIDINPTNAVAMEKGLKRITPYSLANSFLWHKINHTQDELSQKGWGAVMPMSSSRILDEESTLLIAHWIEAGAPLEGKEDVQWNTIEKASDDQYIQCDARTSEEMKNCFTANSIPNSLRLYTPPLTIPPHSEQLICSYLSMPIDQPLFVNRTLGQQMIGGHHAAVFLAVAPSDEVPHPCRDDEMSNFRFAAGAGGGGGQDTQLPSGVALRIDPGQQFVIQSHYLNPSDQEITVMDAVDLVLLTEEEVQHKVDPFAIIHGGFEIPAQTQGFSVKKRCRLEQDIDVYMLLGHTHDYGVLFEVYHHSMLLDEPRKLYHATDGPLLRDNPEIKYFDPPLPFLAGDEIEVHCMWDNTTEISLGWPEEMCVALMYYGPGEGWMTCDENDEVASVATSNDEQGCVSEGTLGNALGVGEICTASGGECADNEQAKMCLAVFDARANFCSFLGCSTDEECGQGALCLAQGPSSACVPLECQ